ncbi:MAG: 2-isopropylmalate synthase [bacterium]|nr:2-isopropylmalate synthase [bacterium]
MEKIIIFDTTLRDGEQSPGASFTIKEKLDIAKQLVKLGVDVIEVGFPFSSKGEFEAVKAIAEKISDRVICGLARAKKEDIDCTWQAIKNASHPRIHTFISTSRVQIKHQLNKTYPEVLKITKEMVALAKNYTEDIEFSPMDATRSEIDFLYEIIYAAIEQGATTVNIPDTVGYAIPEEFGKLIRNIVKNVSNINKAIISVHCHNDLGLSTANSLAAVLNGARQIECTINGIGERAGNAALEEVVMSINTRKDIFKLETNINTPQIYKTSRMISHYAGMMVQPNKSIVGENAFAHESGIHQDGFLKERTTYEIMTPESVGISQSKLVLGKLSGRHAFNQKVKKLGFDLSPEELEVTFQKFKDLADKKSDIFDQDIEAIIEDELTTIPETYKLDYIHVVSGNKTIPTATVKIKKKDKVIQEAACGNGPVDASLKAIDKATKIECSLMDYNIRAITTCKDALGEVNIRIKYKDKIYSGRATSTDIVESSVKAYINAINRLIYKEEHLNEADHN